MQRVRREVPAPAGLAVSLVGVPEASPMRLDLRLEAVVEGVLVSGVVDVGLAGECARCLDPFTSAMRVDLLELFAYPDAELPGEEGDEEQSLIQDERVDLRAVLHDAVVLAMPLAPVCRVDCPGLCPDCGARLADAPGHAHAATDPRWAALAALLPTPDQPGTARTFTAPDPSDPAAVGRAEEN
jgi:uncharacterized protein